LQYELQPLNSKSMVTTPVEHSDLATIAKVSQAISGEIDLKRFIDTLMATALEHAGGDRGLLIVPRGEEELWVEAEARVGPENVDVQIRRSRVTASALPESVLRYAVRSQSNVLLADASDQNQFSRDEYFDRNHPRSILCLPLVKQLKLIGILYIENGQTPRVFTPARMSVLTVLASQAAISLENAYLYADLKRTQGYLADAQRLNHMGGWVWDLSTNKISLSEENCRIFGFTREFLSSSYQAGLDAIHPDDRQHVKDIVEEAVRARRDFDCEFRIVTGDGTVKYAQSRGGYITNELSGAEEYAGTIMDVTDRRRDEEEMRKLVSLIENSTDFIGYCSPAQQIRFLNAGGRRLVGLDLDEDITKYYMKDFRYEEDYRRFMEEILPILLRDGQWVGETYLRHFKTNAMIPVLQTIFFISEKGTGQRTGTATICRDISDRKRIDQNLKASLQEKEALLKEVHHRVKNNLQLISSLLNLQANRIVDPAVSEQFAESRNRVRSMALVHENLYRAGNFARVPMRTHIQNLCAHLVRAYGMRSRNVELVTEIDDVELDLDRAISSGLIINELVSNALKHAFPDDRPGSVRVGLKLLAPKHCLLTVKDDGIGLPADFNVEYADSLGLQLVHDLIRQLHGATSVKRGNGTSFSIAFNADGFAEGA
jgi:PAS domain S-box-containing protein